MVSPVTHTAETEVKNASTSEIPLCVAMGSLRAKIPIAIMQKNDAAKRCAELQQPDFFSAVIGNLSNLCLE